MTVVAGDIDPKMFELGAYTGRFASLSELEQALADSEIAEAMTIDFLGGALARGDKCFGIFDGQRLVSFGWYSTLPTFIADDLVLHFDASWVYMYKGYTVRAYRGQRLHGCGMSLAARELSQHGSRGLISYVDSANSSSLRSVARMGYKMFGDVHVARLLGRGITWASPGCKPFDFWVQWAPRALNRLR